MRAQLRSNKDNTKFVIVGDKDAVLTIWKIARIICDNYEGEKDVAENHKN